jgi:type IV secretory pathway VirB10-like protein
MSNTDDLDDVFGPLRSSATTPELANEAITVDAMTHAHNASKGRITMLNSRKARVATLIAAGIIGFGGVAAAGPGGFQSLELPDEDPVETTIATTVPDEPEEIEEPEVPEADEEPAPPAPEEAIVFVEEDPPPPPDDDEESLEPEEAQADSDVLEEQDDAVAFVEKHCVEVDGVEGNHGKTVSAVAHGDDPFADADVEVEVRDAAHSNCGKKSDADHDEESKEAAESDDDDSDHDDDDSDHDEDDSDHDDDSDDDSDDDDSDDDDENVEKPAKKSGNSASKDKGGNGRGQNKKGD